MPAQKGEVRDFPDGERTWSGTRWESAPTGPQNGPGAKSWTVPGGTYAGDVARYLGLELKGAGNAIKGTLDPRSYINLAKDMTVGHGQETFRGIKDMAGKLMEGDPEALGGVLGGAVMGKITPPLLPKVPGAVRSATAATGRGLVKAGSIGTAESALVGSLIGGPTGAAAAPLVAAGMRSGGRLMQKAKPAGRTKWMDTPEYGPPDTSVAPPPTAGMDALMSPRLAKASTPSVQDSVLAGLKSASDPPPPMRVSGPPSVMDMTRGGKPAVRAAEQVDNITPESANKTYVGAERNVPSASPHVDQFYPDEGLNSLAPQGPKSSLQGVSNDFDDLTGDLPPSSVRDSALAGLQDANAAPRPGGSFDAPTDSWMPDFTFEGTAGRFPDDPGIPGLSIGPDRLPKGRPLPGTESAIQPSAGPQLSPNVRQIPRDDASWGPGSRELQSGLDAQAGVGKAHSIYDPQTPTPYLRQQLSAATDPASREFLARAIAQRSSIDRAMLAKKGLQDSLNVDTF